MKECMQALKIIKVKLEEHKLLKDVVLNLEEKLGVPLLKLVLNGKVVMLVNGKATTDLVTRIQPGDDIVALPVLKGG